MIILNAKTLGDPSTWPAHYHYCARYYRPYGAKNPFPVSSLGNPFRISRTQTRDRVLERCRVWLRELLIECPKGKQAMEFRSLAADSALICWCHPLACHCDVIRDLWEECQGDPTRLKP